LWHRRRGRVQGQRWIAERPEDLRAAQERSAVRTVAPGRRNVSLCHSQKRRRGALDEDAGRRLPRHTRRRRENPLDEHQPLPEGTKDAAEADRVYWRE